MIKRLLIFVCIESVKMVVVFTKIFETIGKIELKGRFEIKLLHKFDGILLIYFWIILVIYF